MNFIKSKVHTTKSLPKKSDSPFIKDNSSKKLDIFPETNFYLKLKVGGMPSPAKLEIVPTG